MADEPEVIRQEMEQTRASLAEKLDALGQRTTETVQATTETVSETVEAVTEAVQDTVSTVQETVSETVETVRGAFDLSGWVDKYPWACVGAAAVAGFLVGRALAPSLPSMTTTEPSDGWRPISGPSLAEQSTRNGGRATHDGGRTEERTERRREETQEATTEHSWFGGLAEQFAPEIDKLKGLAIGTTLGVIRDMITQGQTGDLGTRLSDVINQFTEKLGGTPIKGPMGKGGEQKTEQREQQSAGTEKSPRTEGRRTEGAGARTGSQGHGGDRFRS